MPFEDSHLSVLLENDEPFETREVGDKKVNAFPRGWGKTTIETTAYALQKIVYADERFIVIMSNTGRISSDMANDIRIELEDNDRLHRIFGDLTRPTQWCQDDFITKNRVRVIAMSIGKQMRGLKYRNIRPTLIIQDDVDNSENIRREEQRDKLAEYQDKDIFKAGTKKTNIRQNGTVIHRDGLLGRNIRNPGFKARVFKLVEQWPDAKNTLWEECRVIFCDLNNPHRYVDAYRFYCDHREKMDSGGQMLMPHSYTWFDVFQKLWTEGLAAFESEYNNNPIGKAGSFNMEKFQYFRIDGDWIIRPDDRRIQVSSLEYAIFVDPTVGKTKKSDYCAAFVLGAETFDHTDMSYYYVVDGFLSKIPLEAQMPRVFELAFRWINTGGILSMETTAAQEWGLNAYEREIERMKESGQMVRFSISGHKPHIAKQTRILATQNDIHNGWILFNRNLPTELFQQYQDFGSADDIHDDGPDCIASAKKILSRRYA